MNIVTGYRGVPHITSNEIQGFNQGIFGAGNHVLRVGGQFAATLVDALTVSVADGEGVIQGVHFRIAPGDTDTVSISPGTNGYKRIDYVCARYTKSASTGVESVDLVVVEGTPDATTPTAPTINTGDILNGASPVDFPLWEVDLDGLSPSIHKLFDVAETISNLANLGKVKFAQSDASVNKNSNGNWLKLTSINLDRGTYILIGWVFFAIVPANAEYGVSVGTNSEQSGQTVRICNVANQKTWMQLNVSCFESYYYNNNEVSLYAVNGNVSTTIYGTITAIKIADYDI